MKKRGLTESAMRYHLLVVNIVFVLAVFGIYALTVMNKDEFPSVTIRQGVMAAVYPGATAHEVEDQVAKPVEDYLFSCSVVDKRGTSVECKDGLLIANVKLRDDIDNVAEGWSQTRKGLQMLQRTALPSGVAAVVLLDEFGNTSSLLLAVESDQRSTRELNGYCENICDGLRQIKATGSVKIVGSQREEVAVVLDQERLSRYAIDQKMVVAMLAAEGFRTISGELEMDGRAQLHVADPIVSEYEVGQQVIYTNPLTGQAVRLKDVAAIERRYAHDIRHVTYMNDSVDSRCLVINLEMAPGNNIVAFGNDVDKVLAKSAKSLPPDVHMYRITDQPNVVDSSVKSFLKDLVLSILVVILVMMILFPMGTALVASTSVPVCTAISFGIMFLFGLELNTVTLAAMIVVLGMIVDDSVIVIDGYSDMLRKGYSRWYCSVQATKQLVVPMTIATTSISGMFFPMLKLMSGNVSDFITLFPWTILIALTCSIFYAVLVVPFLSFALIRQRRTTQLSRFQRLQERFFGLLQGGYHRLLTGAFKHPWLTIGGAGVLVVVGVLVVMQLNMQVMPKADRELFAVEVRLTQGSTLEETNAVVDSVMHAINADPRVKNATAFVGVGCPRFHMTYAPSMGGVNFAQCIVNTVSNEATEALIAELQPKYENAFPNAYIRFKQMDYQAVANPIEVRVQGGDFAATEPIADSLRAFMNAVPELAWVHSNRDEVRQTVSITLKEDIASQYGITQTGLSTFLKSAMGDMTMTKIWEGDYSTPVVLYQLDQDEVTCDDVANLMVPALGPGAWVPLRQIADVEPTFSPASIMRINGIRSIVIGADVRGKANTNRALKKVKRYAESLDLPDDVEITYGGIAAMNANVVPGLVKSLLAALLVLLTLLILHFKKISISLLSLSVSLLCVFGIGVGLMIFNQPLSVTALLGVISLVGIIVRNAIIMYDYAESLVHEHHMTSREAAFQAGERRMRPIFLTSATTALGVVPMILAGTNLWMPMGVVICFGTLFTLPMAIVLLPILYWKVFENDTRRFERIERNTARQEKALVEGLKRLEEKNLNS